MSDIVKQLYVSKTTMDNFVILDNKKSPFHLDIVHIMADLIVKLGKSFNILYTVLM